MAADKGAKPLTTQEWEKLLQDFGADAHAAQARWLAEHPGHALLEQALQIIAKKESPLKLQLCFFLEEQAERLMGTSIQPGFTAVVDCTRSLLHTANDGNVVSNSVKEQMMITASVLAIVLDALHTALRALETLVELFLTFINRTNSAADRHVRAVACECLRELEIAYPCLLHACLGHVYNLCQAERTHVAQSYTLLLTGIVHNVCAHMLNAPSKTSSAAAAHTLVSTAVPLVPFSAPAFLAGSVPGQEAAGIPSRHLTPSGLKECHRVMSYLLEAPQLLTDYGLLEFVAYLIHIAPALELHGSLFKHQFASVLHTYSPLLCHVVLMMYANFVQAFILDEDAILKRLMLLCNDSLQPLPFRLLAIHWTLGIDRLHSQRHPTVLLPLASRLHPLVFDSLSLKAAKLDALAFCAARLQAASVATNGGAHTLQTARQLLNTGLTSLSAFKWLPAESTETRLAFHVLHRFFTAAVPQSGDVEGPQQPVPLVTHSDLFKALQDILLTVAVEMRRLVPSLLYFTDRLLICSSHRILGDRLLHTFSDQLVPRLPPDFHLPAYFPLFERMAGCAHISPQPLLQAVTVYATGQVQRSKAGYRGWVMWIRGSQVLGICRILMAHHRSSRILSALADLLAYLTQHFPDLEVRDSARLFLRMLITIPGRKLRKMLGSGDEQEESASHSLLGASPLIRSLSYRADIKRRRLRVASYVVLTRARPLTVPHSWTMVLYNAIGSGFKGEQVKPTEQLQTEQEAFEVEDDTVLVLEPSGFGAAGNVPRVLDAESSFVLNTLRQHFSDIPDFHNGTGFRVHVHCELRFQGEIKLRWLAEADSKTSSPEDAVTGMWRSRDTWPALYAVVISFHSSGPYAAIPKMRLPFVPSMRPSRRSSLSRTGNSLQGEDRLLEGRAGDKQQVATDDGDPGALAISTSLQLDGVAQDSELEVAELDDSALVQKLEIELEPKEPVPTLVEARIVFNDENGNTVRGQLDSVPIGFEDLFMATPCPAHVGTQEQGRYRYDVYRAMWEACGGPGKLGGETFLLKGGRAGVDVRGTESVKLLEAAAGGVVDAVEHWLAPFVVAVSGEPIVSELRSRSVLRDIVWQEQGDSSFKAARRPAAVSLVPPHLRLKGPDDAAAGGESEHCKELAVTESGEDAANSNIHKGSIHILIFLPPRYHMLFKMEVSEFSTLVRIRTDYWPSLAYVDEYLEALIMVR